MLILYYALHSAAYAGSIQELTVNKAEIDRITVEDEGLSNLDLAPALLIISRVLSAEGADDCFLHNY